MNGIAVKGTLNLLLRGDTTIEQTTEIINMWIEITAKKFYSEGVLDGLRRSHRDEKHPTRHLNDLGIDSY